jgi:hypothetical protein
MRTKNVMAILGEKSKQRQATESNVPPREAIQAMGVLADEPGCAKTRNPQTTPSSHGPARGCQRHNCRRNCQLALIGNAIQVLTRFTAKRTNANKSRFSRASSKHPMIHNPVQLAPQYKFEEAGFARRLGKPWQKPNP